MAEFDRNEVSELFIRWRAATDRRDLDEMYEMLAEDAIGGNCKSGTFKGRDAIIQWSQENWPEFLPNRSIWHVIDDSRVVNKWYETLPGEPSAGHDYSYEGISEFIYGGSGKWNFMYGIPDFWGLERALKEWEKDGNMEKYSHLFNKGAPSPKE